MKTPMELIESGLTGDDLAKAILYELGFSEEAMKGNPIGLPDLQDNNHHETN